MRDKIKWEDAQIAYHDFDDGISNVSVYSTKPIGDSRFYIKKWKEFEQIGFKSDQEKDKAYKEFCKIEGFQEWYAKEYPKVPTWEDIEYVVDRSPYLFIYIFKNIVFPFLTVQQKIELYKKIKEIKE